jgi:hypothetical protein
MRAVNSPSHEGVPVVKKPYEKPVLESESVFETLASGCTLVTDSDPDCNPGFGQGGHNSSSL